MPGIFRRLLPLFQLTRMALVFTALADSGAALLLWQAGQSHPLVPTQCLALASVTIGLWGYGMSLNDIIDRRRDRQISPSRPLPSGSVGLRTAHVVCAMLLLVSLMGGEIYSSFGSNSRMSMVLIVFTLCLITFYDFAAKYFSPVGLLSLGLIRFFHAAIAAPALPVMWHPLLLMNHMTLVAAISYYWSQKRPAMRPVHWWSVLMGLASIDLLAVAMIAWRRMHEMDRPILAILDIRLPLIAPAIAIVGFLALAVVIRRMSPTPREAGENLMLCGTLWLIVYDASFVIGYVGVLAGLVIFLLLPISYLAVVLMRWWGRLLLLSQRPTFKRVEV